MGRGRWLLLVIVVGAVVGFVVVVPPLLRRPTLRTQIVQKLGWAEFPYFGERRLAPQFEGRDLKRKTVPVVLERVAEGFELPTDIQFPPGLPSVMVVAQKPGRCEWVDLKRNTRGTLFSVETPTESELGLLGVAFHPSFARTNLMYVHHNTKRGDQVGTRISEWTVKRNGDGSLHSATEQRVVLELDQPFENHNGGQILFGPDGKFYVALGDGGDQGDPSGNGQNRNTLLGKILRLDVDHPGEGRGYGIPRDNPFVDTPDARGEVWIYGLRNPWRFSFVDNTHVVIADVGQDKWEEVSIAGAGENLGWKQREGDTCFTPPAAGTPCDGPQMREPFYVYGRDDGQSITGGLVVTNAASASLRDLYIFGDVFRGKLWAVHVPETRTTEQHARVVADDAIALGRFHVMPSTFGRDPEGNVLVGDLGTGVVYRIVEAKE